MTAAYISLSYAGYCARLSHCFQDNATSETTTTDVAGFYEQNATSVYIDWGMVEFTHVLLFETLYS